ncbi:hypothetical protein BN7_3104 [Wickerhamomyces ciferrii]|uniref:Protein LOT5 n=1 Tax=Wickerhamomyces ciferrii (strain ATCC 14091 / BCRC 22168 / CBS 111 / JCM 3599 / NBRC 0793 / NRRL Y-1031 F-60-10) TaxID=1206466 RepID=K0KMV7_WICCF|nr:uncharacterized protein BN7_3104 [Wickerhamomyces ciferrii]CCH43552.1 hypothetical protein BN7_3104 [Wickerhamomyces ciferrii]
MSPNIISIKPSIENCDPIKKYQKSTPIKYSLQENPILYGGGRKWLLQCSNYKILSNLLGSEIDFGIEDDDKLIDLFVLNTSFIIWFNSLDKGIELSYLDIPAHAVRKNNFNKLELYLQLNLEHIDEILELSFRPKYLENERFLNESIEKLFTYEFFGFNKGNKLIFNTFNSIGKCSCFHNLPNHDGDDQDDEMDEDPELIDININDYINDYNDENLNEFYDNSGNADDLNTKNLNLVENPSSIMVSIYNDDINLKTRFRDEIDESLEVNKKIRN